MRALDRAALLDAMQQLKDARRIDVDHRQPADRREGVATERFQNIVGMDRRPAAHLRIGPVFGVADPGRAVRRAPRIELLQGPAAALLEPTFGDNLESVLGRAAARQADQLLRNRGIAPIEQESLGLVPRLAGFAERHDRIGADRQRLLRRFARCVAAERIVHPPVLTARRGDVEEELAAVSQLVGDVARLRGFHLGIVQRHGMELRDTMATMADTMDHAMVCCGREWTCVTICPRL